MPIRILHIVLNVLNRISYEFKCYSQRNSIILNDLARKTHPYRVNVHWYVLPDPNVQNLGDYLSPIIVEGCSRYFNIDLSKKCEATKHLYAVGSILTHGYQNATVWGSGLLNGDTKKTRACLRLQKLDIRAVRGPLTREVLMKNGHDCPEVYGDPAILMPMFYKPTSSEKRHSVSVIIHHTHNFDVEQIPKEANLINILTTDWVYFIDEICASELVISSTLHGIILAEAYGVPAILLVADSFDMFKYRDYYLSTGRNNIKCAKTIDEAIMLGPMELPQLDEMRDKLLEVFPKDLWE